MTTLDEAGLAAARDAGHRQMDAERTSFVGFDGGASDRIFEAAIRAYLTATNPPVASSEVVEALRKMLDKLPRIDRVFHYQSSDYHNRPALSVHGEWARALYWIIENQEPLVASLACLPAQGERVTSDEIQQWIALAYRDPEDQSLIDAPRFSRWNMEVAYLAGQTNAALTPAPDAGLLGEALALCKRILNHPLIRLTGDVEIPLRAIIAKAEAGSARPH